MVYTFALWTTIVNVYIIFLPTLNLEVAYGVKSASRNFVYSKFVFSIQLLARPQMIGIPGAPQQGENQNSYPSAFFSQSRVMKKIFRRGELWVRALAGL